MGFAGSTGKVGPQSISWGDWEGTGDGVWVTPPQNMAPWYIGYFKPKEIEKMARARSHSDLVLFFLKWVRGEDHPYPRDRGSWRQNPKTQPMLVSPVGPKSLTAFNLSTTPPQTRQQTPVALQRLPCPIKRTLCTWGCISPAHVCSSRSFSQAGGDPNMVHFPPEAVIG